ncbi:hypothetical protein OG897_34085 [Streptomyces sp. NBC_00237]|uniref:hypothetical protein n=1 Tax=Streptomyces sp. NBC_00237 TaxID=2975687 RepID=UPI00225865B9|nr:hypothetical protein [Streptomyces sp. NBC_00237]MCX5206426.1 hypothetical protein [Streptomyces sp. NBC_00237]
MVALSASDGSEESVSVPAPEAGTYTVVVDGYAIPSGTTAYDYRDVYFAPAFGTVLSDDTKPVRLTHGASAPFPATVRVNSRAPEGRWLYGTVQLLNARGTPAGASSVRIERVVR